MTLKSHHTKGMPAVLVCGWRDVRSSRFTHPVRRKAAGQEAWSDSLPAQLEASKKHEFSALHQGGFFDLRRCITADQSGLPYCGEFRMNIDTVRLRSPTIDESLACFLHQQMILKTGVDLSTGEQRYSLTSAQCPPCFAVFCPRVFQGDGAVEDWCAGC